VKPDQPQFTGHKIVAQILVQQLNSCTNNTKEMIGKCVLAL